MKRREFIGKASLASSAVIVSAAAACQTSEQENKVDNSNKVDGAFVISTWNPAAANEQAWTVLDSGGTALDAIEEGIKVEEANEKGQSVGIGGHPDRDGFVTLDACIMNSEGNAGSVVFLEDILHPISVARRVMEKTPHVILAGAGARKFALEEGFSETNLMTEKSERDWEKWLEKAEYHPVINVEMHDTIGMIALDSNGDISGGCSTSGLAYKMRGRVGDSPIIGSGLFVDNTVGAATATGLGEEVIKTVGSFLMVELMRQGYNPQAATEEAISRIIQGNGGEKPDFQVGYLCFNKSGSIGAYSIHPGFGYVIHHANGTEYLKSASYFTA